MSLTEELIHRIERLTEAEREEVLRFIRSLAQPTPLERHIAFMDEIANGIPKADLRNVPTDLAENFEKYSS